MAALKQLLALRSLQGGPDLGCRKLVMNAALLPSRTAVTTAAESSGTGLQGVAAAAAAQAKVAARQYSASEAASLAAKQQQLTGLGLPSFRSSRPVSTFASSSTPAAAAAAAAREPARASAFAHIAAAAAALAAVLALALAPGAAADVPMQWQFGFQDAATSTGQAMQDLHHDIMFFLITVGVLVFYLMCQMVTKFHYSKVGAQAELFTHHTALEVAWTLLPTAIILLIGIPSLTLIYSMDQHIDRPGLTVKIIGHQWYWSYEMHDHLQHKLVDPDRLVAIAEKSLRR